MVDRPAMPESKTVPQDDETTGGRPAHAVEVSVRYAETDQMGRAHHGVYVVWCELGRTSMMRERGVSYAELERSGVLLPVTRLDVDYRNAAYYEETVRIMTRVAEVRSRSVTFAYEVFGPGERLLARARTTLTCTDGEGRVRRLPARVRSALQAAS